MIVERLILERVIPLGQLESRAYAPEKQFQVNVNGILGSACHQNSVRKRGKNVYLVSESGDALRVW